MLGEASRPLPKRYFKQEGTGAQGGAGQSGKEKEKTLEEVLRTASEMQPGSVPMRKSGSTEEAKKVGEEEKKKK
jgi:hypothetical protein